MFILIFVSMRIACFSEDIPLEETESDSECFEYFHKGADLLLLNESQGALDCFEKGHQLAAQSQSDAVILDFCLYFSETMILDMFGYQEQCAQSLSSTLHALEAIENSEEEEDEYPSNSYEKIDFAVIQRSQDLIVKMRHLAGMASSPEVRAILFYIIERIGEELLPEFQFADPFYSQQEDWAFGTSGNDGYSLDLCKKNKNHKKKKHEGWFDKLEKWAERGLRLYKLYREIKKAFEE